MNGTLDMWCNYFFFGAFTIGILHILLKCIDFYAQETVEQHFSLAKFSWREIGDKVDKLMSREVDSIHYML